MKKVLILGAGYTIKPMVDYFIDKCGYEVVMAKAESVFTDLARELLMLQALGDYAAARAFIDKYAQMSAEMKTVLDSLGDIPVDITPQFEVEKIMASKKL